MDVTIVRDGFEYGLHFEKGENRTGTKEGFTKKPTNARKTGTTIRWKPDLEVFTDINIPVDYYLDTLKRQAVVNSHIKFVLKNQDSLTLYSDLSARSRPRRSPSRNCTDVSGVSPASSPT